MTDRFHPEKPSEVSCTQGPVLLKFGETLTEVKQDLKDVFHRMEERDRRLITALEGLADNSAQIESLRETKELHNDQIQELFGKVSNIQQTLGKDGATMDLKIEAEIEKRMVKVIRYIEIATSKPVLIFMGCLSTMVILGSVFDVLYHMDGLQMIWKIYKAIKS